MLKDFANFMALIALASGAIFPDNANTHAGCRLQSSADLRCPKDGSDRGAAAKE
jgi:hypothetical protein